MRVEILFILLFPISLFSQEDFRFLSWNIQNFGQSKSKEQIEFIAEVICPYDVIALQELEAKDNEGEKAVAHLIKVLNRKGSKWNYIVSQATKNGRKRQERYAFLWKSNRVHIAENGRLIKSLQRKVLHEPFVLRIKMNGILVDLYNFNARNYKENPEKEIAVLINHIISQNKPIIILGSFNTFYNNKVYDALYDNSFTSVLKGEKTQLSYRCNYNKYLSVATDNILYNAKSINYISSGVINYIGGCENFKIAKKISNHLPVVARFKPVIKDILYAKN